MLLAEAREIKLGAVLWVKGRGGGHESSGWFKVKVTQAEEITKSAPAHTNIFKQHYVWVNTNCGVYSSNRLYHERGE